MIHPARRKARVDRAKAAAGRPSSLCLSLSAARRSPRYLGRVRRFDLSTFAPLRWTETARSAGLVTLNSMPQGPVSPALSVIGIPWRRVDSDAKCNPVDSIGSSTKSRISHSEPRLLLGFQGTKTARREGISNPFSDAGGCTSPQNSGRTMGKSWRREGR